MNATSTPISRAWCVTSEPPYHSTMTTAAADMNSTKGK